MNKKMIYYLLNSDCNNRCSSCFLETQRHYSQRPYHQAYSDITSLLTNHTVRVTGSDILRYNFASELIGVCGQKYLLGETSTLHYNTEALVDMKGKGLEIIILTSEKSANRGFENNSLGEAIGTATKVGLKVVLSYVIDEDNYLKLDEMAEESVSSNVDMIRFLRFIPFSAEQKDLFLDDTLLNIFLAKVQELKNKFPIKQLRISIDGNFGTYFREQKGPVCFAGENEFIIGLDNIVYPCESLMRPEFALGFFDGHLKIEKSMVGLSNYDCKAKQIFVDKRKPKIVSLEG